MFILTTLNPYTRIDIQKKCFYRWRSLGYNIKTINVVEEAALLLELGLSESDIIKIEDEDTNYKIFNKKIPKIKKCFDLFNKFTKTNDYFMLVNSDIYPCFTGNVENFFNSLCIGLAFTRCEVDSLSKLPIDDNYSHYRGGLDIFFFNKKGLEKISNELSKNTVYERMTFGIPGWDFYLAYLMLKFEMKILDSEIFLHEIHKQTYSDISEFNKYAKYFIEYISSNDSSYIVVAEKFANEINNQCEKNNSLSRTINVCYLYRNNFSKKIINDSDFDIDNFTTHHGIDFQNVKWSSLREYFATDNFLSSANIRLLILERLLETRSELSFTFKYPLGNLHAKAVVDIMSFPDAERKFLGFYDLFCDELFTYNIYNKRILALMFIQLKDIDKIKKIKKITSYFTKEKNHELY